MRRPRPPLSTATGVVTSDGSRSPPWDSREITLKAVELINDRDPSGRSSDWSLI
jgi:hypothetical protein